MSESGYTFVVPRCRVYLLTIGIVAEIVKSQSFMSIASANVIHRRTAIWFNALGNLIVFDINFIILRVYRYRRLQVYVAKYVKTHNGAPFVGSNTCTCCEYSCFIKTSISEFSMNIYIFCFNFSFTMVLLKGMSKFKPMRWTNGGKSSAFVSAFVLFLKQNSSSTRWRTLSFIFLALLHL